jgi:signal transduction histidine kinase
VTDVTRAADIISRISLLFKKGAQQREFVAVNDLIREMIVMLRSEANRYSISIRAELAEHLPTVMADRVQLQQAFMNLMLNGIDAMKEGTRASEHNGTGMGLPISRSIIESHGGHLWASGAAERGATFRFTLPATVTVDA